MAMTTPQTSHTTGTNTSSFRFLLENISYLSFLSNTFVVPLQPYLNPNSHLGRFHQSPLTRCRVSPDRISIFLVFSSFKSRLFSMINMPKIDKAPPTHRNSVSTASAAGGGTRSSSWSAKDDETLIQARAQGLNWNQISPKHFPQKSANACRKRHERLMERQNAEQWDGVKLDILAQAYMEARREMWSILAARVGEKWTLVEQKVFQTVSSSSLILC
jgi:hypothetical protein